MLFSFGWPSSCARQMSLSLPKGGLAGWTVCAQNGGFNRPPPSEMFPVEIRRFPFTPQPKKCTHQKGCRATFCLSLCTLRQSMDQDTAAELSQAFLHFFQGPFFGFGLHDFLKRKPSEHLHGSSLVHEAAIVPDSQGKSICRSGSRCLFGYAKLLTSEKQKNRFLGKCGILCDANAWIRLDVLRFHYISTCGTGSKSSRGQQEGLCHWGSDWK